MANQRQLPKSMKKAASHTRASLIIIIFNHRRRRLLENTEHMHGINGAHESNNKSADKIII